VEGILTRKYADFSHKRGHLALSGGKSAKVSYLAHAREEKAGTRGAPEKDSQPFQCRHSEGTGGGERGGATTGEAYLDRLYFFGALLRELRCQKARGGILCVKA